MTFVVCNLYSRGTGVLFLFVMLLFAVYSRAAMGLVFSFVIFPFGVYTHVSQGFTFSL